MNLRQLLTAGLWCHYCPLSHGVTVKEKVNTDVKMSNLILSLTLMKLSHREISLD